MPDRWRKISITLIDRGRERNGEVGSRPRLVPITFLRIIKRSCPKSPSASALQVLESRGLQIRGSAAHKLMFSGKQFSGTILAGCPRFVRALFLPSLE